MSRKPIPKRLQLDVPISIRANKKLKRDIQARANQLDMTLTDYINVLMIYDLRFNDVTEHIEQLVKNGSIGYTIYPGDEEHDKKMLDYWSGKMAEKYSKFDPAQIEMDIK